MSLFYVNLREITPFRFKVFPENNFLAKTFLQMGDKGNIFAGFGSSTPYKPCHPLIHRKVEQSVSVTGLSIRNLTELTVNVICNDTKTEFPSAGKLIAVHEPMKSYYTANDIPVYEKPTYVKVDFSMPEEELLGYEAIIISELASRYFFKFVPAFKGRVFYPNTNPGHVIRGDKQQIIGVDSLIEVFNDAQSFSFGVFGAGI